MCKVEVVYQVTIQLDDMETRLLKQILERAEALSTSLGKETEDFRKRLVAQLPQEA